MSTFQASYKVGGMTCQSCAQGIVKHLKGKGIAHVDVSYAQSEVFIQNPDAIEAAWLKKALTEIGYELLDEQKESSPKGMSQVERYFLIALVFTLPLWTHMFVHVHWLMQPWVQALLTLPVFVIGLLYFGKSALNGLKAKNINMDVLVSTGFISAFLYSMLGWLFTEQAANYLFFETSASIITFVLLGNVIEKRVSRETAVEFNQLQQLLPAKAEKIVFRDQQIEYQSVAVSALLPGDRLRALAGEKIAADGPVLRGEAWVKEDFLSGESQAKLKKTGDQVLAGSVLEQGEVEYKAQRIGAATLAAQMADLVKAAQRDKPSIQKIGDRISEIFVPIVIGIALLTFSYHYWLAGESLFYALMCAIAVLVIACPCAMGLATPTAIMAGIGKAAKKGILFKSGRAIEQLAQIKQLFTDKTGTLTTGALKVENPTLLADVSIAEVAMWLIALEKHSRHPLSPAIIEAMKPLATGPIPMLSEAKEQQGKGIEAKDEKGRVLRFGSALWLDSAESPYDLLLKVDNTLVAGINVVDESKQQVPETIQKLMGYGINITLLSGDNERKCHQIAAHAGITEVLSARLPEQKYAIISASTQKMPTAMVGDGLNDAAALKAAHVGISMGKAIALSQQAADIIIPQNESFASISEAYRISRQTLSTIKQNFFWAFCYNIIAIPMAAAGMLNPAMAAFIMAFSDVVVIGNSIRLRLRA